MNAGSLLYPFMALLASIKDLEMKVAQLEQGVQSEEQPQI